MRRQAGAEPASAAAGVARVAEERGTRMRGYPFSPFGFKTGELVILGRYFAAVVRFIPGGHVLVAARLPANPW
jgi:hypothetical protein